MTNAGQGQRPEPGPGAMFADVVAGVIRLVKGELALARAEAVERVISARRALVQVVIAAILVIAAINLLAAAAVLGLSSLGLSLLLATCVVGVVVLLIALGIGAQAMRSMSQAARAPERSAASLRRDVETFQTLVGRNDPT